MSLPKAKTLHGGIRLTPLAKTVASEQLQELESQFEGGDKFALLVAIRICANHDIVLPPWVATAFISRFDAVLGARATSWDEVFGSSFPKGAHVRKIRRDQNLALEVFERVSNRCAVRIRNGR